MYKIHIFPSAQLLKLDNLRSFFLWYSLRCSSKVLQLSICTEMTLFIFDILGMSSGH